MEHTMRLKENYYNFMLNGTKRIELRLNDEKRQLIKVGDIITFVKDPETGESFQTQVIELIHKDNFSEILDMEDMSIFADKLISKEELLNILEEFYPKDKQKEYGALGIRIKLIK